MRAAQIGYWRWSHDLTFQFPGGGGDICRDQTQQVVLPLAALNGDVDLVMAVRVVRSGPTGSAWKVETLDADQHTVIVALRGLSHNRGSDPRAEGAVKASSGDGQHASAGR